MEVFFASLALQIKCWFEIYYELASQQALGKNTIVFHIEHIDLWSWAIYVDNETILNNFTYFESQCKWYTSGNIKHVIVWICFE